MRLPNLRVGMLVQAIKDIMTIDTALKMNLAVPVGTQGRITMLPDNNSPFKGAFATFTVNNVQQKIILLDETMDMYVKLV